MHRQRISPYSLGSSCCACVDSHGITTKASRIVHLLRGKAGIRVLLETSENNSTCTLRQSALFTKNLSTLPDAPSSIPSERGTSQGRCADEVFLQIHFRGGVVSGYVRRKCGCTIQERPASHRADVANDQPARGSHADHRHHDGHHRLPPPAHRRARSLRQGCALWQSLARRSK